MWIGHESWGRPQADLEQIDELGWECRCRPLHPGGLVKDVEPMEEPKRRGIPRWAKPSLWQPLAILVAFVVVQQLILAPAATRVVEIPYSQFKADLRSGNLKTVTVGTDQIVGTLKDGTQFSTVAVADPDLPRELEAEADEEARILRLRRGDATLVADFGTRRVEFSR